MAIRPLRTVVVDRLDPEPLAAFRGDLLADPAGNEFCLLHLAESTGP